MTNKVENFYPTVNLTEEGKTIFEYVQVEPEGNRLQVGNLSLRASDAIGLGKMLYEWAKDNSVDVVDVYNTANREFRDINQ